MTFVIRTLKGIEMNAPEYRVRRQWNRSYCVEIMNNCGEWEVFRPCRTS